MGFDKDMVRVYNRGRCGVALGLQDRSVLLQGTLDPEFPTMETFTLKELEYVNTHTPVIRNGMIEFNEEEREEIYNALRCKDWRDTCIFENEINDMLISPSLEIMQKILNVKDMPTIDRIYAHMEALIAHNAVDVSNRVQMVVRERRKELTNGTTVTKIRVTPKQPEAQTVTQEELAAMVAAQVAEQMGKLNMATPVAEESAKEEPVIEKAEEEKILVEIPVKPKTTRATKTSAKKTK